MEQREQFPILEVQQIRSDFQRLLREIGRIIVGHRELVEHFLISIFAGGHILLEGPPGLGKTILVKTLAKILDVSFSRIQFTSDLMPADIIGTYVFIEKSTDDRHFHFQPGPIFANIVMVDEINRANPKTQSALLECMQEKQVTIAGQTHVLEEPFWVLGTQNPIEMHGTFPLPESQLDRFFSKLYVDFPSREELNEILDRTTRNTNIQPEKILDRTSILKWMALVRDVYIASEVQDYVARLILATHPNSPDSTDIVKKYVHYGASPRGAQALVIASKIKALMEGRYNVSFEDVAALCKPTLRHRVLVNFEAESQGITGDNIINSILKGLPRIISA